MYLLKIELTCAGYGRGFHIVTEPKAPYKKMNFITEEAAKEYAETHYAGKNYEIVLDILR